MSDRNRPDPPAEVEIYRDGETILEVSRLVVPAAVELLQRTVYGTSGIRYQHTNQQTKIQDLGKPLFFYLRLGGRLIGMYCLDERTVGLESSERTAFYGRYLAVDEASSGNGYGQLLKQKALDYVKQTTPPPFLFYSFIEEKNTRSMAISRQQGFQSIATLKTYFFRRYAPKRDPRLATAQAGEMPAVKALLRDFYAHYSLTTLDHIGYQGQYFVLKEAGQIVAGIQANLVSWRFYQMPGIMGWMLMNLVPRFGFSRRFFNPTLNSFLVVEGLYFQPGREALVPVLLESVLAHFGQHSAMCEIDKTDPLIPVLTGSAMGLLSGFEKGVTTHVLVKGYGVSDRLLQTGKPVYTSSFDYA